MKKSSELSELQTNKSDLVAEAGLLEARVLPNKNKSWLQHETTWFRAIARRSGCQPATALATECKGIIA
ncbi:MAG: hypothetical protein NTU85_01650 [Candidatus Kaiserbacteria bacterium]|nr:hypothetical protein [Candidatus Kaiserbacteria bacterium]